MTIPPEAVTCPECGHPARSPEHYIDVGRRHRERDAAAEREAFFRDIIGYRIGDHIYAPEDVTIIRREEP